MKANSKGLPYAPGRLGKFDSDGSFQLGDGVHGLTCATFVLAVFEHAGLPLVDVSSWPQRSEDQKFRELIVEALQRDLAKLRQKLEIYTLEGVAERVSSTRARVEHLEHHIEVLRSAPVSARFRPEEVAAASSLDDCPAPFGRVTERARQLAQFFAGRA